MPTGTYQNTMDPRGTEAKAPAPDQKISGFNAAAKPYTHR